MESEEKTPLKKYINYGMPRLSTSVVLGVIDLGLLRLYTEGYSVDPLLAGVAMGMGKLAIAASQFLMGWLSDKINTRLGKRKPFMFIGAPIVALCFIFLLLPTLFLGSNASMMEFFVWMLVWDMMLQFFYGELTTPYQSWMAEQFEVHERPKASAFQNLFGMMGTGVGTILIFLVLPNSINDLRETGMIGLDFTLITIIFALLLIGLYYFCALIFPREPANNVEMHFIADVKQIFKDRNYMKVCFLQGIAFLAWGMVTPTLIGFVEDVLGFTGTTMYIAAAVLFLGIIIFLFSWKKLIDKKGKKETISIIFIAAVIILPFSLIGLIPGEVNFAVALLYTIGVAACLGGWYLFPYIWYADLAEDAKRRGDLDEMKAGLYAGFPNVLLNIFQAIALVITGVILSLPNVPGKSFSWGYVLWGVWCSGVLLIGYFYIKNFIKLDFDWEKEVKK